MRTINSFLKVFESRKIVALLLLGFASGLPLFLTSKTLQAWMTQADVDLTSIGLFSLVGLPYSLKFLWSPLMDRFVPPFLGRRRGWLLITQILLVIAIATMSLQNPKEALSLVAVNALLIAFFSASQDIVGDAYRTDILEKPELGAGAAVFVLGYRIALLATGALALILADRMSWNLVYLSLAGIMSLCIIFTLFAPEPKEDNNAPQNLVDAVILPFQEYFQRSGITSGLLMLLFIILYKLGDGLLGNMATPFLLSKEMGFTNTDIGAIQGGMGLLATIVGTLVGGSIMSKIGINKSLWIFGGLQAISNLSYFVLAQLGHNYQVMVISINIENFCGGLGTAAFVAFLMSLCNHKFSATQYALLSSLYAVSRDILVAPAGKLAQSIGWSYFFLFSLIIAIPGLLLLPWFAPWNPRPLSISRPGMEDED
jgi:MFS transporter, PAT family, beta-lactamase induction signal transducer AmpG